MFASSGDAFYLNRESVVLVLEGIVCKTIVSLGKTIASLADAMTSLGKAIASRDKTIGEFYKLKI
jgi:hypothetical protein